MKGFQEAAQEAMGKMTPEQMQEIRKSIESMSDEEKQNIMKMFSQRFDPTK
jgi:DNA-binding GntR family transcriptional regulator